MAFGLVLFEIWAWVWFEFGFVLALLSNFSYSWRRFERTIRPSLLNASEIAWEDGNDPTARKKSYLLIKPRLFLSYGLNISRSDVFRCERRLCRSIKLLFMISPMLLTSSCEFLTASENLLRSTILFEVKKLLRTYSYSWGGKKTPHDEISLWNWIDDICPEWRRSKSSITSSISDPLIARDFLSERRIEFTLVI